jgi:hypothetical protein
LAVFNESKAKGIELKEKFIALINAAEDSHYHNKRRGLSGREDRVLRMALIPAAVIL